MSNSQTKSGETKSLVLVGVGGQGILLASEIIARTITASGLDVKMNEIHGMAQRGGSVVAQIRFGHDVASPLVPKGTARALVALERIEILRYIDYLAPDGLAVVSDQEIIPVTVSAGAAPYPVVSEDDLRKVFPKLLYVEAVKSAEALGNVRAANTILLGALSNECDFPVSDWEESIRSCVKPKFIDVNLQAFHIGRDLR